MSAWIFAQGGRKGRSRRVPATERTRSLESPGRQDGKVPIISDYCVAEVFAEGENESINRARTDRVVYV
jgi:hypothetical protein